MPEKTMKKEEKLIGLPRLKNLYLGPALPQAWHSIPISEKNGRHGMAAWKEKSPRAGTLRRLVVA